MHSPLRLGRRNLFDQFFISLHFIAIVRSVNQIIRDRLNKRSLPSVDQKTLDQLRRECLPAPIVRSISKLYMHHHGKYAPMLEEVRWFGEWYKWLKRSAPYWVTKNMVSEWDAMYDALEKMWRTAC